MTSWDGMFVSKNIAYDPIPWYSCYGWLLRMERRMGSINNHLSYLRNGGMGWLFNVVHSYGLGHSSSHYV